MMRKPFPKVNPARLLSYTRDNGLAVPESRLQPSFQDDRDVREWFGNVARNGTTGVAEALANQ